MITFLSHRVSVCKGSCGLAGKGLSQSGRYGHMTVLGRSRFQPHSCADWQEANLHGS